MQQTLFCTGMHQNLVGLCWHMYTQAENGRITMTDCTYIIPPAAAPNMGMHCKLTESRACAIVWCHCFSSS